MKGGTVNVLQMAAIGQMLAHERWITYPRASLVGG
jgi:hypothetical protein